jgi:hypothetical protein
VKLGVALCNEYTRRYGKIHACTHTLNWMKENAPRCNETYISPNAVYATFSIPEGCTPPPMAMPQEYIYPDLVESYRLYYNKDKRGLFSWKTRNVPKWIEQIERIE